MAGHRPQRGLNHEALLPFGVLLGTTGTVGQVFVWLIDQLTDLLDMSREFSRITLMLRSDMLALLHSFLLAILTGFLRQLRDQYCDYYCGYYY